jgi:hypothetical protein
MFADFRVHGLNKMGEAHPFSFPVSRCRPAVKALEKGHVQPMYAKVREHGAPVRRARLGGEAGKVEDEMTAAPQIELKSFISLLTRPRKSAPRDDKVQGGAAP